MSRQEGSVASRILAHMAKHPQPWRARPLAEALQSDVNTIAANLSSIYADGKGPLTRCQVTLHGSDRPFFEYRIAESASGGLEVNRPTDFKISTPKRPPRRDEIPAGGGVVSDQPAVATAKPEKKTRKPKKAKAPKQTRAPKKAKKARAPYGSLKKPKTPAKRQRNAKLQATAAKLQRSDADLLTGRGAPGAPGFRCAVFSDGSLAIHAKAGQIELQEPETRQLFAYLERVVREIGAP